MNELSTKNVVTSSIHLFILTWLLKIFALKKIFLLRFLFLLQKITTLLLKKSGDVLLQLRDNIPDIVEPNTWTFPGGHKEKGEKIVSTEQSLKKDGETQKPGDAPLNEAPNNPNRFD